MTKKTQQRQLITDPRRYFIEEFDLAVECLKVYMNFRGFHFEQFANSTDPNVFQAGDFIAVKMLSVEVPPGAVIEMTTNGEKYTNLLKLIDPELSISQASGKEFEIARSLWHEVSKNSGMRGNGVITSKLLHAKRPNLLPIRDTHVLEALFSRGEDDWDPWHSYMKIHGDELSELTQKALLKSDYIEDISTLRAIDIVVWMRNYGMNDLLSRDNGNDPNYGSIDIKNYSSPPTFKGRYPSSN